MLAADRLDRGVGVAYVDDDGLDALIVAVALTVGALVALLRVTLLVEVRELRLDALANLHNREVGRGLQHRAGDDVADALGELLVDLLAGGIADNGVDLVLGGAGGEAARVLRGHVNLVELGVVSLLVHGVVHRVELVDVDLAAGAVDGDLRAPIQLEDLRICVGQGLLEPVEEVELVDVLVLAQLHQGFDHLGCHKVVPLS